jgi:predicted nucleic acid-binding protein
MKKNLVAIDSSCLIALQADEKLAKRINQNLIEKWDAYCSEMAILELFYVLCRNSNLKKAQKKVEALVNSHVIEIIPVRELLKEASRQKCIRAIAIADCLTIALAKNLNGKAIFYRKETELKNAIKKKPFDIEIIFLLDEA